MSAIALDPLVAEARRRARRRRLFLALCLFAAAVGGYAIAHGLGGSQPLRSDAPMTAALCKPSALELSAPFQGASQAEMGGFTIENGARAACSLPIGIPRVAVTWRGKSFAIRNRPMTTPDGFRAARTVAPGKTAYVFMQWQDQWYCQGPRGAYEAPGHFNPRLVLHFPDGLTLAATASHLVMPGCGTPGGAIDVSRAITQ
jgi:hypothetical protein